MLGGHMAGLVDPVLEQLAVGSGVVDQAARMRTQPGEQRQLLAAHQHVDRIDLDQTHPVERAAEVAAVDATRGATIAEALGAERDPSRLRG